MSQTITVEELTKISLDKGDVLAVKVPADTGQVHIRAMMDSLKKVFPDNRVLVFAGDVKFEKIEKKDETTEDSEISA